MSDSHKRTAYFNADGDWFIANDVARGPWSVDACHAGPPTALLARAVERVVSDKQLARLTVTFRRPIPMAGFRADVHIEREGRGATTANATLIDRDGRQCAVASSLSLATNSFEELPSASIPSPVFDEATPGEFPVSKAAHDKPFFFHSVDVRYPPGQSAEPGPTVLWMRTVPIIENEAPTPFQSLCPLADCGNGTSRNADIDDASFINPDLTIIVHRLPQSEWLASQATSFWQPNGVGMSHAMLFDIAGPVGTALQTLLVKPSQSRRR